MSYSQYKEDLFLNKNFFKNKRDGVYIELGALDGVLFSNTKFFEDTLNWSGILIEPHPDSFNSLKINRPNNILFSDLVSCNKENLHFRYFKNTYEAVSGVENTLSQHHFDTYFESNDPLAKAATQCRIIITPRTLTELITSTNLKHIDFMSLDVEGHEYEVLQSWDFSIPIDLILIEMLGVQPEKDELCRKLLIDKGYTYSMGTTLSEIYVRDTSLFS